MPTDLELTERSPHRITGDEAEKPHRGSQTSKKASVHWFESGQRDANTSEILFFALIVVATSSSASDLELWAKRVLHERAAAEELRAAWGLVAHLHHCVLVIASQYLGPRVARVCLALDITLDIPADHRLRSVGGRSRCVEVRPHPTTGNPLKSSMKSGVSSPISQISPALTNPDRADEPAHRRTRATVSVCTRLTAESR